MFTPKSKFQGFSLIELMVVLAIAAILVGIGIPSFSWLIQKNRTASQTNALIVSINYARSEAMKRGQPVMLASADGSQDWSAGWQVYLDKNNNGSFDDGEALRIFDALPGSSALTATQSTVIVNNNGFLNGIKTSGSVVWTLTQNGCSGNLNRTLTLYPSGRNLIQQYACS